jgi:hypothetical protein
MSEFLILIYDEEAPYANANEELWQEVMDAHQRFTQEVGEKGGRIVGSRATQPTNTARSIREDGVADGPFVDTPKAFCGYYLIDANDLDHAVEIATGCPAKFGGVEVRPVMPTRIEY